MRQVIKRFLNHLEAEKNASHTTIESYRYDLANSTITWLNDWETDSCREMSPATTYETISCGSQRSVIKGQTVPRLVRGRSQPSGRFSITPIVQVCYGIIQQQIFRCQKLEWAKYALCLTKSVIVFCECRNKSKSF